MSYTLSGRLYEDGTWHHRSVSLTLGSALTKGPHDVNRLPQIFASLVNKISLGIHYTANKTTATFPPRAQI